MMVVKLSNLSEMMDRKECVFCNVGVVLKE